MSDLSLQSMLADSGILAAGALKHFVDEYKIHPILVNFTAALIPVSFGSDLLSSIFRRESLRNTGWWALLYAMIITPFTAVAGWLFWMPDDNGVTGMTIHKWLGTAIPFMVIGLFVWRAYIFKSGRWPGVFYLLVALIMVAIVTYQGSLGGDQVFSGP